MHIPVSHSLGHLQSVLPLSFWIVESGLVVMNGREWLTSDHKEWRTEALEVCAEFKVNTWPQVYSFVKYLATWCSMYTKKMVNFKYLWLTALLPWFDSTWHTTTYRKKVLNLVCRPINFTSCFKVKRWLCDQQLVGQWPRQSSPSLCNWIPSSNQLKQ